MTRVDPATKQLSIKNFGDQPVDLSQYQLCALFEYTSLNQPVVTVLNGNLLLDPGSTVLIHWDASTGFNTQASDIGLYIPFGSFTSPAAMVSFFEYGAGQLGRENVAVAAGLWTVNTFLEGDGPWIYTGNGNESGPLFWIEQGSDMPDVVINELDAHTPGNDNMEFIELIGNPGESLDGLVLVLFSGSESTNSSYGAYNLAGYNFDSNGLFVIGNTSVPGASLFIPENSLSNGPAAVALYTGDSTQWPDGTAPSSLNLVDALVYSPQPSAEPVLTQALTPNQQPAVEPIPDINFNTSISRIPDGGSPFDTQSFILQLPTPGAFNTSALPSCAGGVLEPGPGQLTTLCAGEINPLLFFYLNNFSGEQSIIVATDEDGTIVRIAQNGDLDLNGLDEGSYTIRGAAYTGQISGLAQGNFFSLLSAEYCLVPAPNSILILIVDCTDGDCSGGQISTDNGYTYVSICIDGEPDILTFQTTSSGSATYNWIITNEANEIVSLIPNPFNADLLSPGNYRIRGISHVGQLISSSIAPGIPVALIESSGDCVQLSSNFIQVVAQTCTIPESCTELFISEYIEGTGNNKALEIFNPTPFPVNLAGYGIYVFNNGSTEFNAVFGLSGTLASGATYVIANPLAAPELLSAANATSTAANFNGNDAIQLRFFNAVIDQIGVVGENPGTAWIFGSGGSTADKVLVRRPWVKAPTSNWLLSTGQWDVYPPSDFSHIGSHSMLPCSGTQFVSFSTPGLLVDESIGSVSIAVNAFGILEESTVMVSLVGGTAIPGLDFVNIFPLPITIPPGASTHSFDVQIIDDELEEGTEFFQLALSGPSQISYPVQVITVSIAPNDPVYEYYPIADIKTTGTDGLLDSLEIFCELRGIVHGINFNSLGLHFHLIDHTGGIKVFNAMENLGYSVSEGDSIHVRGMITQFFGQAEILPAEIEFISSGNTTRTPIEVTSLSEEFESLPVTIRCVRVSNAAEWSGEPGGFFVTMSSADGDFIVRIDGDSELFAPSPIAGEFLLTGIVEQFDENPPFDSNYTIWPGKLSDVNGQVVASFNSFSILQYGDEGATVPFENTSTGASSFLWSFGDGNTSEEENPVHEYAFNFLAFEPDFEITLIAIGECRDTTSSSVTALFTAIEEFTHQHFTIYPNPASDALHILADEPVLLVQCYELTGQLCATLHPENENNAVLPCSHLSQGIYVIDVTLSSGKRLSTRFVVQ